MGKLGFFETLYFMIDEYDLGKNITLILDEEGWDNFTSTLDKDVWPERKSPEFDSQAFQGVGFHSGVIEIKKRKSVDE